MMKKTYKLWWLHLWWTICKFKISLATWSSLFILILLIYLLFGLNLNNPLLSLLLGTIASILATAIYRIADTFEESYNAHKALVNIAQEFCHHAAEELPSSNQPPKDYDRAYENYLSELRCKQAAMRDLYTKLIKKSHYNHIAKDVALIYVTAQKRMPSEDIGEKTAALLCYLSELG